MCYYYTTLNEQMKKLSAAEAEYSKQTKLNVIFAIYDITTADAYEI